MGEHERPPIPPSHRKAQKGGHVQSWCKSHPHAVKRCVDLLVEIGCGMAAIGVMERFVPISSHVSAFTEVITHVHI